MGRPKRHVSYNIEHSSAWWAHGHRTWASPPDFSQYGASTHAYARTLTKARRLAMRACDMFGGKATISRNERFKGKWITYDLEVWT